MYMYMHAYIHVLYMYTYVRTCMYIVSLTLEWTEYTAVLVLHGMIVREVQGTGDMGVNGWGQ